MKYLALIIRVMIIVIGIRMLCVTDFVDGSIEAYTAIGFILVGLYLSLQAIVGPKSLLCPFKSTCKEEACNK